MTVSTAVFPKYWNKDRNELAYGVELTPARVPIYTLLGSYAWTYLHDSHYGARLVTPSYAGSAGSPTPSEDAGHLTLSLDSDSPDGLHIDGDVESRVRGSFSLGHLGLRGTFDPGHLQRAHSASPSGEPVPIPSRWTVRVKWRRPLCNPDPNTDMDCSDPADDDIVASSREEHHYFDVCAVRDDAGHPFVQFVWDGGMNMGRPYRISLLGRRMPDRNAQGGVVGGGHGGEGRRRVTGRLARSELAQVELTAGERRRLGMGMDEGDVARLGKAQAGQGVLMDSSNAQAGAKRKLND